MRNKENEKLLLKIAELCKTHREALGIPKSQIAFMARTSTQNIDFFEKGKNNSAIILLAYLKIIGVNEVL